jgi:hypothetical protein
VLRGSRPGERRGGRKRDTPNRRTILTDRILGIGSDHPTATRRAFLKKLVADRRLPADTRMSVAANCFPAKRALSRQERGAGASGGVKTIGQKEPRSKAGSADWNPQALDALFGIVRDAAADPKVRRIAARKIAECLLPKAGKKPKALSDMYGFRISPRLATSYRDLELEVRALVNDPTSRLIPAIAEKLKKLQARSEAIRARLEAPCPTRYGNKEAAEDYARLRQFYRLRENKTALTEAQNAEEAHVRVRFDLFANDPEAVGRRRRKALEDAELRSKKSQLFREFDAPPLSRKEKNELKLLRWLYPKPSSNHSQIDVDEFDSRHHPFYFEQPAADGNLYPRDSKLRPTSVADDPLVKAVEGPPISPVGPSDTPASGRIKSAGPAKIGQDSL